MRGLIVSKWGNVRDPYPLHSPQTAPWRKPLDVARLRRIVFGQKKKPATDKLEESEQVLKFEKKEKKREVISLDMFEQVLLFISMKIKKKNEQIKKRVEPQISVIHSNFSDKQQQINWMIEDALKRVASFQISNSQKEHLLLLLTRYFNSYQFSDELRLENIEDSTEKIVLSIQLLLKLEQQRELKGLRIYAEVIHFFCDKGMMKEAQFVISSFLNILRKGELPLSSEEIERMYHPLFYFYYKQNNFNAASELLQTIINNSSRSSKRIPGSLTPYFNRVLEIFSLSSEFYRAKQLFLQKDILFIPNGRTFEILIDACNSSLELDDTIQLMFACSFAYKESTWNALIRVRILSVKANEI